jgi:hypothetical protein
MLLPNRQAEHEKGDIIMLAPDKTKERLITPFKSRISKRPVTPGTRVTKGEWSKRLDNMGFSAWAGEDESRERKGKFENQVKWDIAQRNFAMLKSCISIDVEYNEGAEQLAYTIDLYGDGSKVKQGLLYISRGDYLMFYMRMPQGRRKELIVERIALANVGELVPYITLEGLSYDDPRKNVHTSYKIII